MPQMNTLPSETFDTAQALDLALLADLEACWENLRSVSCQPGDMPATTHDLHSKQKAYNAFHVRLVAYNKRYKPAHVPELLLNTPLRLGGWCRAMHGLLLRVEHERQARCPVHLLEKAYRLADRLAAKAGQGCISRPTAPYTVAAAIQHLEAMAGWCDDLAGVRGALSTSS